MHIFITDEKGCIKGAYFNEDIANKLAERNAFFVTKVQISDQTNIPYAQMLEEAKRKMASHIVHGKMIRDGIPKHVAFDAIEELFAKLIVKVEKYDKLVEMMNNLYAEESEADLCDIGEQIATKMGYL